MPILVLRARSAHPGAPTVCIEKWLCRIMRSSVLFDALNVSLLLKLYALPEGPRLFSAKNRIFRLVSVSILVQWNRVTLYYLQGELPSSPTNCRTIDDGKRNSNNTFKCKVVKFNNDVKSFSFGKQWWAQCKAAMKKADFPGISQHLS